MKRVVRKKIFKVFSQLQPAWLAWVGVLLFLGLLLMQRKKPMNIKPIMIGWGQVSSFKNAPSKTHNWNDHQGWWGGYWWGSDSFFWKGREWGLGKSAYPWYWEYDKLALELNLTSLAKKGRWSLVESNILKKISELEQEEQVTDNNATKRKLERTINRLEYYLYNAKNYQRTPVR